ncbi:hypothetical protein K438DRAFT_1998755 [Mycena galopus ATCC 62051]|nr:hypothetical protein K438DRAFT_1998755 [Mycena galopus ATCC 62051]
MSSFANLQLSKPDEDSLRKLYRTVRATHYEDPVDQDAFLVASAHTVLQFRPFISSFAHIPDIGEIVFLLRNRCTRRRLVLAGLLPKFSPLFKILLVKSSAGAILTATASMLKLNAFAPPKELLLMPNVVLHLNMPSNSPSRLVNSVDDDTVSIPSSGDATDIEEPLTPLEKSCGPAPFINTNTAIPSSSQAPLSPLSELEGLMVNLRMGGPPPPTVPNNPFPAGLSVVTAAVPTGPRAERTSAKRVQFSRKRSRSCSLETKDTRSPVHSRPRVAPQSPKLAEPRPSHAASSSSNARPPSAFKLRRRLADVQAEIRRLSCTEKQVSWELQSLQEPRSRKPQVVPLSA